MNLREIRALVMFQTSNDQDDLGDYMPYLTAYIAEGYDRLVQLWAGVHTDTNGEYPPLYLDSDSPRLPTWTHRAIADWATWCVYRNGNSQKQNRGFPFRQAAEEIAARIVESGGAKGKPTHFHSIPD